MTGWIVVIAFLLAPLACWALLARTKVLGWTFALVFAAYAVTEGILAPNGRFGGFRLWLLPGLAVMSVVALAAGAVLEGREFDAAKRPRTGRNVAGMILSSLYGIAVVGGVLLLVTVIRSDPDIGGFSPSSARVPSSSYVLPLGPGLKVQQDPLGCGTSDCGTDYYVTYPGRSERAALQQVVSQLDRVHGWGLSAGAGLIGCRRLGGQDVCVQVIDATASRTIMIELDAGPHLLDGG